MSDIMNPDGSITRSMTIYHGPKHCPQCGRELTAYVGEPCHFTVCVGCHAPLALPPEPFIFFDRVDLESCAPELRAEFDNMISVLTAQKARLY